MISFDTFTVSLIAFIFADASVWLKIRFECAPQAMFPN